jgi:phosphoenolpyruvate carboxykinase (GTP)
MLQHDTIFTNVAVTDDMQPWWEGLDDRVPAKDWQGRDYDPASGEKAAHPNSRFTVASTQCPSWSPEAESAQGVPISAIVFGGRRQDLVPLVFEARDWAHGVLVGASMASEKTAAATDVGGTIRRDPMAMKPFCGYNYGDYFAHWLAFDKAGAKLPRIFHVNWFRRDGEGHFIWPGFGENLRVLEWMLRRIDGEVDGDETPIGIVPREGEINTDGLKLADDAMAELLTIDADGWKNELAAIEDYLDTYGEHCPKALKDELKRESEALAETPQQTRAAAS